MLQTGSLAQTPAQLEAQAEAILLQQELARRRAQDPLFHYKPGPTQRAFHQCHVHNRLITGGNRSGKTTSCVAEIAGLLRMCHPFKKTPRPVLGVVMCNTREQAVTVFQRKLIKASELPGSIGGHPFVPEHEIDWKESGTMKIGFRVWNPLIFKNGSELWFQWSGTEDAWKKLEGRRLDFVYVDESAGTTQLMDEIPFRLADSRSEGLRDNFALWLGAFFWGATGTKVNPAFEDFLHKCDDPDFPDFRRFTIPASENKAISKEVMDSLTKSISAEQKRIRIDGTETAAQSILIFGNQFDRVRNVLPEDFEIQDDDVLWLSYDPGIVHPTGILLGAIRRHDPNTLNLVKFWAHGSRPVDYDAQVVDEYLRGRRVAQFIYDTDAAKTRKDTFSTTSTLKLLQQRFKARGIWPIMGFRRADKRVEPGIELVRNMFISDPTRIRISPDACANLIRQIRIYRHLEATETLSVRNVVKKDDEGPDCLRYMAMRRPYWAPDLVCGPPLRSGTTVLAASRTPLEIRRPASRERTRADRRDKVHKLFPNQFR